MKDEVLEVASKIEVAHPPVADVETPFGVSHLICWGDTARLMPLKGSEANLEINGVPYIGYVDVRLEAGSYISDHISLNRAGSIGWNDYTPAAMRKAREELPAWINTYLAKHPEFVREGYLAKARERARRAFDRFSEIKEQYTEIEQELQQAMDELASLEDERTCSQCGASNFQGISCPECKLVRESEYPG